MTNNYKRTFLLFTEFLRVEEQLLLLELATNRVFNAPDPFTSPPHPQRDTEMRIKEEELYNPKSH